MIRNNPFKRINGGGINNIYSRWAHNALVYQITPNAAQSPDFPFQLNPTPSVGGITTKVNIGGVWKDVVSRSVNIGGVWKSVVSVSVNIGGVWKLEV